MSKQKGMAWIWPDTSDEKSVKEATRQGIWACAWVAGVTAIMAFLNSMSLDQSAFIDAFIFAVIGFGIYKYSRTAAIAGLAMYILERIYMWSTTGIKGPVMALILILMFVNSIRGTFAYHKNKKLAT